MAEVAAAPANAPQVPRVELGRQEALAMLDDAVVPADANLDAAVPGAAMAVYNNTGQVCTAGTRLFVQRSIQSEFVARLGEFSRTVNVIGAEVVDKFLGLTAEIVGADYVLPVPEAPSPMLAPLLSVLPGQLFAAALARAKGLDPDRPPGLGLGLACG